MLHKGSCHCGTIELAFETGQTPEAMAIRRCQCSFCRKHNTRAVADPGGHLTITVRRPNDLNRYRFGLKTADYLICRSCGVYVAAITTAKPHKALVIVNALNDEKAFCSEPTATDYSNEGKAERIARRQQTWTPCTMEVAT